MNEQDTQKREAVLVINPGSTSTKFALYSLNTEREILREHFSIQESERELSFLISIQDEVCCVLLRVVHGGKYREACVIDRDVEREIEKVIDLAPIHNQRALHYLSVWRELYAEESSIPEVYAFFDTAFHASLPEVNRIYAIPQDFAETYGIYRYGFHGIALSSALRQVRSTYRLRGEVLPEKMIFLHLGGGASITAVRNGKSYATSMGLSPLSGIPMVTRSGDIDPSIFPLLMHRGGFSLDEIIHLLNHRSGLYGLSGIKDVKTIIERAESGEEEYKLAFTHFLERVVERAAGYVGILGGVDALVFSGGIASQNAYFRSHFLERFQLFQLSEEDVHVVEVDEEEEMFLNFLQMLPDS